MVDKFRNLWLTNFVIYGIILIGEEMSITIPTNYIIAALIAAPIIALIIACCRFVVRQVKIDEDFLSQKDKIYESLPLSWRALINKNENDNNCTYFARVANEIDMNMSDLSGLSLDQYKIVAEKIESHIYNPHLLAILHNKLRHYLKPVVDDRDYFV